MEADCIIWVAVMAVITPVKISKSPFESRSSIVLIWRGRFYRLTGKKSDDYKNPKTEFLN